MKVFKLTSVIRRNIYISFFFLLLTPALLLAAPVSKIYVVDMQTVINRSVAGKAANERIQREAAEKATRIKKLQGDFEAFQRSVQKQKALLSAEAFEQRLTKLEEKRKELGREIQTHQAAIQKQGATALNKIVDHISGLMPKLAAEVGAPMILEKSPQLVVYIDPKYDLTEKMVTMLNSSNLKL